VTRTQQAIQWLDAARPGEVRTQSQAAVRYGIKQPTISAALAARRARNQCPGQRATLAERDRCATLARAMGAHGVALAILHTDKE